MQRIHIGQRSLRGSLERYARQFDLLEVRFEPGAAPRPQVLRRWRRSVPPTFVFSVVLPLEVTKLQRGSGGDDVLESALDAARVLESPFLVIPTPLSVTPTATHRSRLADLVDKLPKDVVRIAWEPAGIWENDEAQALAERLGLTLVRDAAREQLAPGPVAYTRLRGLGEARELSPSVMDRMVASLRAHREVYVVVETDHPARVARTIRTDFDQAGNETPRITRARTVVAPFRAEDEEQE